MNRRTFLRNATLSTAALTAAGCFGSFPAIRWVYSFNRGISGSKFIQWLVFLVLTILPVYGIAALIDVWILNSLEFWFGGSPVSDNEEPSERHVALRNGETLKMRRDRTNGVLEIRHQRDGDVVELTFLFDERGARVLNGEGRELARTKNASDGSVRILSDAQVVAEYTADEAEAVVEAHERGGAPAVGSWAMRSLDTNPRHADSRR